MEFKKYTSKFVKKGTIIQHAGDTSLNSYFVKEGLLRSYIIDDKGKEHIFLFAPEGWIAGDAYAVIQQNETQLFIEAIEDSEVYIIKDTLEDISFEDLKIGVQKILNRVGVLQNRVLMQMSSSAQERYQHFLDVYPGLTQRVPQRMIASYLGITPQALSRIRSNWPK